MLVYVVSRVFVLNTLQTGCVCVFNDLLNKLGRLMNLTLSSKDIQQFLHRGVVVWTFI